MIYNYEYTNILLIEDHSLVKNTLKTINNLRMFSIYYKAMGKLQPIIITNGCVLYV